VLLPDGQVRWIAGRGRVEFGGGKPLRMRGVSLDITERRRAELDQGASEARVVLDNSDGAFACGHVWVHYPLSQTCRSLGIVLMGKFRSLGEAERPSYTFSALRALPSLDVGRADAAWKISPSHSTARPNSAADSTPILCITWARCALNVRSLAPSTSAICFIEQAPNDKRKDLALARRQAFVASAPLPLLPLRSPRCGAPGLAPAAPRRATHPPGPVW
jgi:hypothetical protein